MAQPLAEVARRAGIRSFEEALGSGSRGTCPPGAAIGYERAAVRAEAQGGGTALAELPVLHGIGPALAPSQNAANPFAPPLRKVTADEPTCVPNPGPQLSGGP